VADNSGSTRSRSIPRSRSIEQPRERLRASIDDPSERQSQPTSAAALPGERVIKPGAYGPITIGAGEDDDASRPSAPARSRTNGSSAPASGSSEPDDDQPPAGDGGALDDSASAPRRPTWRDLAGRLADLPLDESLRRASNTSTAPDHQVITLTSATVADQPRPTFSRIFAGARPKRDDAIKQSVCRIDPTERRLIDFQLPAVDGKWVSLRDIDADVILLDFWGSWCAPCRTSIAHLIELQPALQGKRFQVVGIACEVGATPEERQARAARAAKELGINYPVLVTTKGGSCPLQQALQVQFYPTLVLLDSTGRILAREQGATDATLVRMDRAIADATRR
jgi:thiol-disulfide isomerase/thioredoxin